MPRKRKDQEAEIRPPQIHSAWPHLFANRHLADKMVASPEFQLLLADLQSHRRVNAEYLIRMDESKELGKAMKTRGIIWALDLLLALPAAVDNWKKQP
jgi:hypothetical protein